MLNDSIHLCMNCGHEAVSQVNPKCVGASRSFPGILFPDVASPGFGSVGDGTA